MADPEAARLEGRILMLVPEPRESVRTSAALREAGIQFESCHDVGQLCEQLASGAGAAVLTAESLSRQSVARLKKCLARTPAWLDFPLIFLMPPGGTLKNESPLAPHGFEHAVFLNRPVDNQVFVSVVKLALQSRRNQFQGRDVARQHEKTIAELTARLREMEEQMEAFTYSVSHDLRAPLRAIRGFAQALAEDYSSALDATGRDYLKRMEDGADRLDLLIQDVLQYSRLGRSNFVVEPVDTEDCLRQTLKQLEPEILPANAQIEINGPLPAVLGHEPTLHQVLRNLISNAVKFVEPGVRPHVRIWSTANDQTVRLWVGDNGIGIAPAYHQRIFGVFERLHSTESYPGTGIGLAIVAKGVTRMGGRAGVESAPKEGSRFWIELPQALPPPASRRRLRKSK